MKKIVLGAVLILLITFGFSIYYILSNLDSMVKAAIESYGSEATQTTVKVEDVKLGLKDGSGAIRGLTVGNPQGFTAQQAFSLGEISAQIDLNSLSREVTVIEHITVQAPKVFFELNQAGKNNLDALKQNLGAGRSKSSSSTSPASKQGEPKLIIRKLLFVDGNIHATVVPLNKNYDLTLPRIEMKNLGGKNGATPTQIADQILNEMTTRALAEIKKKGVDQYKGKVEEELNKRLGSDSKQVGEQLKGLLNY